MRRECWPLFHPPSKLGSESVMKEAQEDTLPFFEPGHSAVYGS